MNGPGDTRGWGTGYPYKTDSSEFRYNSYNSQSRTDRGERIVTHVDRQGKTTKDSIMDESVEGGEKRRAKDRSETVGRGGRET